MLSISTNHFEQQQQQQQQEPSKQMDNNNNNTNSLYVETANGESWFQPNLARESVQSLLQDQEIGSFVIRLSNSCKECFALSIRVPYFANPSGIAHYLITRNSKGGYKLKGVEKEFKSLRSLVTHYSVKKVNHKSDSKFIIKNLKSYL